LVSSTMFAYQSVRTQHYSDRLSIHENLTNTFKNRHLGTSWLPSYPRSAWARTASRSAAMMFDAERPGVRSHAERGNELAILVPTLCVGTDCQPLCGSDVWRGASGRAFPRRAWERAGYPCTHAPRGYGLPAALRQWCLTRSDRGVRSHAERGNELAILVPTLCVGTDCQPLCGNDVWRGASGRAFPRRAWERAGYPRTHAPRGYGLPAALRQWCLTRSVRACVPTQSVGTRSGTRSS